MLQDILTIALIYVTLSWLCMQNECLMTEVEYISLHNDPSDKPVVNLSITVHLHSFLKHLLETRDKCLMALTVLLLDGEM